MCQRSKRRICFVLSLLKKKLSNNLSFSDFIRKKDIYPSRWHNHVQSWLDKPNIVLLVKYEDLLNNTYNEVLKIVQIINREEISEEIIRDAIDKSSFKNMQQLEIERGRPFLNKKAANQSSVFVRKGEKGDWKNYFSQEDEDYLMSECGLILKKLSYV